MFTETNKGRQPHLLRLSLFDALSEITLHYYFTPVKVKTDATRSENTSYTRELS